MKLRKLLLISVPILSVVLMLAGVAVIGAQDSAPGFWLSGDTEQVSAGQELTITLHVRDTVEVYGGSFKLAYDPQVLEVVLVENKAVTPGAFFADQAGFTLKNAAADGVIEYALTLTQPALPVSGDGVVGTVTFRALAAGTMEIAPVEVRLLSPVFTEVNGRLIAQEINEVATQAEGLILNPGSGQPETVVQAPAEQPAASAPSETQVVSAPPATYSAPAYVGGPSLVVIIGALLFVAGLSLFTLSIGAYVSLYRQSGPRDWSW